MNMEICPNCCEELKEKKYNHRKRLKCTSCGYETSSWEIEQESKEFMDRIQEANKQPYNQNDEL